MNLKVSASHLERILKSGQFAVTMEVSPPCGADIEIIRCKAELLRGIADAYNVTDNQTAMVHMSSIAGSKILLDAGLEPVMQMTCRDRNRIALQSDLLGAWALGIRNCLCISGDHPKIAALDKGHRGTKTVFDLDSIQLISLMKGLKDKGMMDNGELIDKPIPFFTGAAWTPFAPPEYVRVLRLAKKIEAGANFIQTQAVFDTFRFADSVRQARDMGLTERAYILAGIIVPRSVRMLEYVNNSVPGIEVLAELIERMRKAGDARKEGIHITVELINRIRSIKGVHGIHLQAIGSEKLLPEIIERANLLPRP